MCTIKVLLAIQPRMLSEVARQSVQRQPDSVCVADQLVSWRQLFQISSGRHVLPEVAIGGS